MAADSFEVDAATFSISAATLRLASAIRLRASIRRWEIRRSSSPVRPMFWMTAFSASAECVEFARSFAMAWTSVIVSESSDSTSDSSATVVAAEIRENEPLMRSKPLCSRASRTCVGDVSWERCTISRRIRKTARVDTRATRLVPPMSAARSRDSCFRVDIVSGASRRGRNADDTFAALSASVVGPYRTGCAFPSMILVRYTAWDPW